MLNHFSAHNHSDFSNIRLIDSVNKVKSLIKRARELGLKGIAITDHEALSAHVEAIRVYKGILKDENISSDEFKLALGDEIYLVPDIEMMRDHYGENDHIYYHFLILAKDEIGYRQLKEISSTAWANSYTQRGMERVPIDYAQLAEIVMENPGHLIGSTACLGGYLPKLIMKLFEAEKELGPESIKAYEIKTEINRFINYCKALFGDDFYLEVQPSMTKEQLIVNDRMNSIGKSFEIPLIFTTDSHYLKKEDRLIHKAYLNSKNGEREVDAFYSTTYLMNDEEVWEFLKYTFTEEEFREMVANTHAIADKCEFYDLFKAQIIPELEVKHYDVPKVIFEDYEYLNKMACSEFEQDRYWYNECMKALVEKELQSDKYWSRLNEEAKELWLMSDILGLRMTAYYNTMKKIIELVWNEGNSLVGPARGSATGFLSCYLLDITQLDPIKWSLPHWRHLTHTRPELPDIDFDTMASRRKQIIQAVRDHFNRSMPNLQRLFKFKDVWNVLNIATFGTEGPRSACLTACRGYSTEEFPEGVDVDVAQYLTSMIPSERGQTWPLHDVVYGNEEKERRAIPAFVKEVNKYEGLLDIMFAIEGIINKRSIHASGVYIYNKGFLDFNALMKAPNGQPITQFNMGDSDYMGSLKYDFLTVEALDKEGVCLDLLLDDKIIEWQGSLKATYDKYLHPDVLDYDNEEMWDLMGSGEVINLFQFDTPIGAQCAKKIKPHSLPDMASANSLMRLMADHGAEQPADKYNRFKNNINLFYEEMVRYGLNREEIEVLKPHLLPVFGVANTQEDVMELVMNPKIANFTLQDANKLRKGIAKKKASVINEVKTMYFEKGLAAGTRKCVLDYIWIAQITPQLG